MVFIFLQVPYFFRFSKLGFPSNENFCEKKGNFAKMFFMISRTFSQNFVFFFAKMNFAKGSENDAEFCDKNKTKYATISRTNAIRSFRTFLRFFSKRSSHFAGNPNQNPKKVEGHSVSHTIIFTQEHLFKGSVREK